MTITDDRGVEQEERLRFVGARSSAAGFVNAAIQLLVAWLLGTAFLVFSCLASSVVVTKFAPKSTVGTIFALVIPLILSVAVFVGSFNKLFKMRFLREAVVKLDGCPACGYEIARLPPEPDGCRVCPECGGAWRVASERGGS